MNLVTLIKMFLLWKNEGNENSGNHGHAGRPGKVGGSAGVSTANGKVSFEFDNENTLPETKKAMQDGLAKIPAKELAKSALKKVVAFDNAEDVYRAAESLGVDMSAVEQDEQVHGFFDPKTGTAYVSYWDSRLGKNSLNVLYHEFAHSVVGLDEEMALSYAESLGLNDK